jgi:hypothetical protein
MKTSELEKRFEEHQKVALASPGGKEWSEADWVAILFASEEVALDKGQRRVIFKSFGGQSFAADESVFTMKQEPEWLALIDCGSGRYKVAVAACDPFADEASGCLPTAGGWVKAVPMAWLVKKMKAMEKGVAKNAISLARSQPRALGKER